MRINRKPTKGQSFMDLVGFILFGGMAYWAFSLPPSEATIFGGMAFAGVAGIALYGLLFGYP
jgi:hypothetical protein